ncbi:MAG: hypothetical protein AMXMBFR4_12240 [Candidatus Hydrogenedentota bacterium]
MNIRRISYALIAPALWSCAIAEGQAAKSLKAENGKRWYKGQTHTHTLWSDGDGAPELAVSWYKDQGYDFLSITDHNVVLQGERWFIVNDKDRLTHERLAQLKAQFGEDWVETIEAGGELLMRLKTLEELRARFEEPGRFLLIEGEEITAKAHVNGLNIRERIEPSKADTTRDVIREHVSAVEAQSRRLDMPMISHVDHPNWGDLGVPAEDLVAVDNARFFEVYNGHGGVKNWGDEKLHRVPTDRWWDIVLSVRLSANPDNVLYGVATDDAHNYFVRGAGHSIPGRGWCMVLADKLEPNKIIEAFMNGDFYASAGVLLDSIEWNENEFRVDIDAESGVRYRTVFYGTRKGANVSSDPVVDAEGKEVVNVTRIYGEELGRVLHETDQDPAVYAFRGDELYVRAKVVSSKLKQDPFKEGDLEIAWTQPVVRE